LIVNASLVLANVILLLNVMTPPVPPSFVVNVKPAVPVAATFALTMSDLRASSVSVFADQVTAFDIVISELLPV